MNYENFSAKDFMEDAYFQSWVKSPTVDNDHFWKEWIENHPHQHHTIRIAKDVLLYLAEPLQEASQEEIIDSLDNLKRKLNLL